jgi:hypothetical protein
MPVEPVSEAYREWEATISPRFQADALWRLSAYRYATYLSDLAWEDAVVLERRVITRALGTIARGAPLAMTSHALESSSFSASTVCCWP